MSKPLVSLQKMELIQILNFLLKEKEGLLLNCHEILYSFFKQLGTEETPLTECSDAELPMKANDFGLPVYNTNLGCYVHVQLGPRVSRNPLKSSLIDLRMLARKNPKDLKKSIAVILDMGLIAHSLGLLFDGNNKFTEILLEVLKYCILLKHVVHVMKNLYELDVDTEDENDDEQGACAVCHTRPPPKYDSDDEFGDGEHEEIMIWTFLDNYCGTFCAT